jgi:hypothetical protein
MSKQINKYRQSLLLTAFAFVIAFGVSSSVLAQKAMTAKFPKPDFKVMEEYYEVIEYEYDYTTNIPQIYITAKKKEEKVPTWWVITWRDAKGVKVTSSSFYFSTVDAKTKIGEPVRGSGYAPWERQIPSIKSIEVSEHESPHWAWNNVDANDALPILLLD